MQADLTLTCDLIMILHEEKETFKNRVFGVTLSDLHRIQYPLSNNLISIIVLHGTTLPQPQISTVLAGSAEDLKLHPPKRKAHENWIFSVQMWTSSNDEQIKLKGCKLNPTTLAMIIKMIITITQPNKMLIRWQKKRSNSSMKISFEKRPRKKRMLKKSFILLFHLQDPNQSSKVSEWERES